MEELVKTGKLGRISGVSVATVLSDVQKVGSRSSCQHRCAGWICVPGQDGFSSEKNGNADVQDVQGNYPQGITGWTAYKRTISHAISTDPLSCLRWLG